ncbi:MAG: hypothetical protein ACLU98_12570 [Desulfovibrio fairfieldensis]
MTPEMQRCVRKFYLNEALDAEVYTILAARPNQSTIARFWKPLRMTKETTKPCGLPFWTAAPSSARSGSGFLRFWQKFSA